MDKTIFASDECVVCLDGAPVPYFMPCGHQCCCQSCSSNIMAAGVPCPLCRHRIEQERHIILEEHDDVQPVPAEQLRSFREERRVDYLAVLKGPLHTKNAAFKGKGKFARQVGQAIGNELEQRRLETAGGERCMTPPSKITLKVEDGLLHVTYKVGRKPRVEVYECCEWDQLEQEMRDYYQDRPFPSVLSLATHAPAYYWLIYHYKKGKLEAALAAMKTAMGK